MSIKEIPISAVDAKMQQALNNFIPQDEAPLIICHQSEPPSLYVLTKHRVALVALTTSQYNRTIVVHLKDIVSIEEATLFEPGLLFGGTTIYAISLFGHDSQRAIVGFRFPRRDELYVKFTQTLKEAYENSKMLQESKNMVTRQRSAVERMRELEELLKNGFITEAEYKQKREMILNDL